jgi:hypothetical protein
MLQAKGTHTTSYQAIQARDSASTSSTSHAMVYMCCITAMPAYAQKSTEELRYEDYSNGNKFGSNVALPGPQFPAQQYFFNSSSSSSSNAAPPFIFGSSSTAAAGTSTAQPAYQTTLVQEHSSSDGSTCMVAMFTVAAMPSYMHLSTEELRF